MKKLALALTVSAAVASPSFAGTMGGKFADPVIEPEIIIEETRKSASGILVPIMLLVVLAAAIAVSR